MGGWVRGQKKFGYLKWASHVWFSTQNFIFGFLGELVVWPGLGWGVRQTTAPPPPPGPRGYAHPCPQCPCRPSTGLRRPVSQWDRPPGLGLPTAPPPRACSSKRKSRIWRRGVASSRRWRRNWTRKVRQRRCGGVACVRGRQHPAAPWGSRVFNFQGGGVNRAT